MFQRPGKKSASSQAKPLKDLTTLKAASELLAETKRQQLLKLIEQHSALDPTRFKSLGLSLIEQLVNYTQSLPETSHSFYSQAGGLIDHALNRTEAALELFNQVVLADPHGPLSEEQKLWQYALFSAGILQGIGKLFIDYAVSIFDQQGQWLKDWNPLHESLNALGKYYQHEFKDQSDPTFRKRLNLLLARQIMPVSGFQWLASQPEVLAVWLALLNEDMEGAGTLGILLVRADALALQRYLDEILARKLASLGGRTGRAGTFTDTTPQNLNDLEQKAGVDFIQWLRQALAEGKLILDQAPLLSVPGGLLLSSELFQFFMKEHPGYKNWLAVQKGLLSLGMGEDQGLQRFEHSKTQQIVSGHVLSDYAVVLPEQMQAKDPATGQIKTKSALEVLAETQSNNQFVQSRAAPPAAVIQQLNANGQWQVAAQTTAPSQGVKSRG